MEENIENGEPKMRSEQDIRKAAEEFGNRVWYLRYQHEAPKKPVREVEKLYGKQSLKTETEFDAGFINGKLSALRWVLGNHWDLLDAP